MGDGRRGGWHGGGWCCGTATPPPPPPWVLVWVGDGDGRRVTAWLAWWWVMLRHGHAAAPRVRFPLPPPPPPPWVLVLVGYETTQGEPGKIRQGEPRESPGRAQGVHRESVGTVQGGHFRIGLQTIQSYTLTLCAIVIRWEIQINYNVRRYHAGKHQTVS